MIHEHILNADSQHSSFLPAAFKTLPKLLIYSVYSMIHRVSEAPPPPFFGFLFSFYSYSFRFSQCLLYHCFLDLSSLLPPVLEHRSRICEKTAKTLFHTLPPICSSSGLNLVHFLLFSLITSIINADKIKSTA